MRRLLLGFTLLLASTAAFAAQAHLGALQELIHDVNRGTEVIDRVITPGYLSGSVGEIQILGDVKTLRSVRAALDAEALAAVREAKGQELRHAIKDYYAAASAYLADPSPTTPPEILARIQARGDFMKAQKLLQIEMP